MRKLFIFILFCAVLFSLSVFAKEKNSKNVIIMIADGIGFNGWLASNYYLYGANNKPYYQKSDKSSFYGMSHWSQTVLDNHQSSLIKSTNIGYLPLYRWKKLENTFLNDFNPVNRIYTSYTCSAASASAIYTGKKVKNRRLSYKDGKPLVTIFEEAAKKGYDTGIVTNSYFYDATTAAGVSHQKSRYLDNNIIKDILSSDLDVIIGGVKKNVPSFYKKMSEDMGFSFSNDGKKLIKTFPVSKKYSKYPKEKPRLDILSENALSFFEKTGNNFFLVIEAGQVDWANHVGAKKYMLKEMQEFDDAISKVIDWINKKSSFKDTMLIITSDHETCGIWGPKSYIDNDGDGKYNPVIDRFVGFNRVKSNGIGQIPDFIYSSENHTNELVPFWCISDQKKNCAFAAKYDDIAKKIWGLDFNWNGSYIDNTDVYYIVKRFLGV